MKYVIDINPYVESRAAYKCDKLLVELTEATKTVTVKRADTYGAPMSTTPLILTKTLPTINEAVSCYTGMIAQIQQGDVIQGV